MNVLHQRFMEGLGRCGWLDIGHSTLRRGPHQIRAMTTPSGHLSFVDLSEPGPVSPTRLLTALRSNVAAQSFRVLSESEGFVRRVAVPPIEWIDAGRLENSIEALLGDTGGAQPIGHSAMPLLPLRSAALDDTIATQAAVALFLLRRDHDDADGIRHAMPPSASSIWDVVLVGPDRHRLRCRRRTERNIVLALSARPDAAARLLQMYAVGLPGEIQDTKEGESKPC